MRTIEQYSGFRIKKVSTSYNYLRQILTDNILSYILIILIIYCLICVSRSPLVSNLDMEERLRSRSIVKLGDISANLVDGDIPGDWVIFGIIAEKSSPKNSSNGQKYITFKLSNLASDTVNLFLFSKSFERHWKELPGTVVAVLNPRVMPVTEVYIIFYFRTFKNI